MSETNSKKQRERKDTIANIRNKRGKREETTLLKIVSETTRLSE